MISMYCVRCRRSQPVYRTLQATDPDGSVVVRGACPVCGKQLFVPVASAEPK